MTRYAKINPNSPSCVAGGSGSLPEYAVSAVLYKNEGGEAKLALFINTLNAESELDAVRFTMSACSELYPGWTLSECCGAVQFGNASRGE